MPVLIVHYHEIWLKGCNRNFFISKLRDAVKRTLGGIPGVDLLHENNRIVVRVPGEEDAAEAALRLKRVPGIANLSVARETGLDLGEIIETGAELMRDQIFETFRVRARRAVKNLPFHSQEVERALGTRIAQEAIAAGRSPRVNLEQADATCWVEMTQHRALIYTDKIRGVGGLPTATAGRLVCLLSGGFDSAVAAYKIIKRGVRLTFVHFHSPPARPGEDSPPVARELTRVLTPYQLRSRLVLVPFHDIQRQIVANAPDEFRLLLYRRLMLRIAEKIARRRRAHGLVTGDSLAQVASQTLQNLEAVGAAATLPLYRPLIGEDKQDILEIARHIGTYEISSEPFTDCCPVFLPKNPRVFSTVEELNEAESRLDIQGLVSQGLSQATTEVYEYRRGKVALIEPHRDETATERLAALAR